MVDLRGLRVVFLHFRAALRDEELVERLAEHFAGHGCNVFWDRHVAIGPNWAREFERRIREADAIVPLVSEASIRSETLAQMLKIAGEASAEQAGFPRILPVRVRYSGRLPRDFAAILGPLETAVWQGVQDDEELVSRLTARLQSCERRSHAKEGEGSR
jgi:hypothetical protein